MAIKLIIWSPSPRATNFKKAFRNALNKGFTNKAHNSKMGSELRSLLKDSWFFIKSAFYEMRINLSNNLPGKHKQFRKLYNKDENKDAKDFFSIVLEILNTTPKIKGEVNGMTEVLKKGNPVLLVANHPYVPIDAFMLMTTVLKYRSDCSVMANIIALKRLYPNFSDYVIPIQLSVGLLGSRDAELTKKSGINALRKSIDCLNSGKCLILFPAGQGSKARAWGQEITDPPWLDGAGHIVKYFADRNKPLTVLPVFVEGHMGSAENSKRFQQAVIDSPVKTAAALQFSLFNAPPVVTIQIGNAVSASLFRNLTAPDITKDLRAAVYSLANEIPIAS